MWFSGWFWIWSWSRFFDGEEDQFAGLRMDQLDVFSQGADLGTTEDELGLFG